MVARRSAVRFAIRFGVPLLAGAVLAITACSPDAPQAITPPDPDAQPTSAGDAGSGGIDDGATSVPSGLGNGVAQIRRRVGNGRALAAASAGDTTIVATTIGVDVLTSGTDGSARPTATAVGEALREPADRVALAPDGSSAVIGWSSTTELWSLTEPFELLATSDPVRWAAITADGSAILVSFDDVRVLDAVEGSERARVEAAPDRTIGVATADPAGAWWATSLVGGGNAEILLGTAAGADAEAIAIDGTNGADIGVLTADAANDRLLIGLSDPALRKPPALLAFDLATRTVAWSVPLAFDERWGVSGGGEILVVGSAGSRLIGRDGTAVAIANQPSGSTGNSVAPLEVRGLPGGSFIILFDDGTRVTTDAEGRPVADEPGLARAVTPLGPQSGAGSTTVVDRLGRVDVLDADGELIRRVDNYVGGRISDVAIGRDGSLAIATSAGSVQVLADTGDGEPIARFEHPEGNVDGVAFSRDGSRIITGVAQRTGDESFDDTVVVWDRDSGTELHRFGGTGEDIAGCSSFVNPVTVSADGSFAVGVSHDFTAYLLDGESFERERLLSAHLGPILDIALSPDGSTLVTTSEDLTLKVIDVATGDLIDEYQTDLGGIRTASFLPDGEALVIGDLRGQLQILNLASGEITRTFDGSMSRDTEPEISPDGRLVAAGDGASLRLWSVETGQIIGDLVGHSGQVNTAAFSPDGASLVSGSTDGTAVVWDLAA